MAFASRLLDVLTIDAYKAARSAALSCAQSMSSFNGGLRCQHRRPFAFSLHCIIYDAIAGVRLPFVQYVASLAIVQAVQEQAKERLQVLTSFLHGNHIGSCTT